MGRSSRAITAVGIGLLLALLAGGGVPSSFATGVAGAPAPSHSGLTALAHPAPAAAPVLTDNGLTPTLASFTWTASTSLLFSSYELSYSDAGASGPFTQYVNITTKAEAYAWVYGQTPGADSWWMVTTWTTLVVGYMPSASTVLEVTQPAVANLTIAGHTSTSVTLNWTNSATYGGNLSFVNYSIFEASGSASPASVEVLKTVGTHSYTVSDLASGTSYSFYVATADEGSSSAGTGTYLSDSNSVGIGTPLALSAHATAEPGAVDVGQRVSFTCQAVGGVAPYNYSWAFGDTGTGYGTSPAHVYGAHGVFDAVCTVTDTDHIQATGTAIVSVSPSLSVSAGANRLSVAPGTPVAFFANSSGGPGGSLVYSWSFGDGAQGTGAETSHSYAGAGNFTASLSATDTNGASADALVRVNVSAIRVTAKVDATSVLVDTPVEFTATAVGGGGGPYAFSWSFGDQSTDVGASVFHAFLGAGVFTASVTATDRYGASNGTDLPLVQAFGSLTAQVTVGAAYPVAGQSTTLTAVVTGGTGNNSCAWAFGDGTTATGCVVDHAWSKAGSYDVTVTVTNPLAGSQTAGERVVVEATHSTPAGGGATGASKGGTLGTYGAWIAVAAVALVAAIAFVYDLRHRTARGRGWSNGHRSATTGATCVHCGAAVGARTLVCPKCHMIARSTPARTRG
jgi:hypothetical protein